MSAKKNTKANGDASKAKKPKASRKANPKPRQRRQRTRPNNKGSPQTSKSGSITTTSRIYPSRTRTHQPSIAPARQHPKVSVGFSVASAPVPGRDRHFEVVLSVNATAKRGDETMFVLELSYGGEVSVAPEMDERNINPVVMIEAQDSSSPSHEPS